MVIQSAQSLSTWLVFYITITCWDEYHKTFAVFTPSPFSLTPGTNSNQRSGTVLQWRGRDPMESKRYEGFRSRTNARMNLRKWKIIRAEKWNPEKRAGCVFLFVPFLFCLTLMWIRLQFVTKWLFRSHECSLSNSIYMSECTIVWMVPRMSQIKNNQLWMGLQALDPLVCSGALIVRDFCLLWYCCIA